MSFIFHNLHVAYDGHTGGGAEERMVTANFGDYTVPQGKGVWVHGVLAICATPALTSYVRLDADEWDDEDIIAPVHDLTMVDAKDYYWLPKPRFLPGGSVLRHFSVHGVAEDVYCMVVTRQEGSLRGFGGIRGETQHVLMTAVAASVANTWTQTKSHRFPAQKGPYTITGGVCLCANGLAARLIIPQAPNSARPAFPVADAPKAGVEGSIIEPLLEPVQVPQGETVILEEFNPGIATSLVILEFVTAKGRTDVPASGGSVRVLGPSPRFIGSLKASAVMF